MNLTDNEKTVLDTIGIAPISMKEIIDTTKMDEYKVSSAIVGLEFKAAVKQLPPDFSKEGAERFSFILA